MEALIMSLISGGVGGNLAGMLMKKLSLGTLWNTVVGIVGGGAGGQILEMLGMLGGDGGLIGNIAGSAVGGGALMAIVSFVKNMMASSKQAA